MARVCRCVNIEIVHPIELARVILYSTTGILWINAATMAIHAHDTPVVVLEYIEDVFITNTTFVHADSIGNVDGSY